MAEKLDGPAGPLLESLRSEITALEAEIRAILRSSTQFTTLSVAVVAAIVSLTKDNGTPTLLPVAIAAAVLTVIALLSLNASIDANALGELRDTLAWRANALLGENVYLTGALGKVRRRSPTSLAGNVLAAALLVATWIGVLALTAGSALSSWAIAAMVISLGLVVNGIIELTATTRRSRAHLARLRPEDKTWSGPALGLPTPNRDPQHPRPACAFWLGVAATFAMRQILRVRNPVRRSIRGSEAPCDSEPPRRGSAM